MCIVSLHDCHCSLLLMLLLIWDGDNFLWFDVKVSDDHTVVFQSQQWLALLPHSMRDNLMRCHSLDYSLPPDTAEQTILQHIFQALCFVDKLSSMSHCSLIQTIFGSPQTFLAQIYNDLFQSNPTKTQLESYCESLGMRPLELKSCLATTAFIEYLTNCCDGSGWTVDSADTIIWVHSMKLNELLILC